MRFSIPTLFSLLLAPLAVSATNLTPRDPPPDPKAAVADDDTPKATTFNGKTVPPMTQISGPDFNETIKDGYWLVKAFSPYCMHCKHLAPKWQTLYEFYYTSDPVPASSEPKHEVTDLNTFSRYYKFKFATLDCIAFQDVCVEIDATQWPGLILYKDGKEIRKMTGDKSMEKLSGFIEECLELIKPGSRPHEGVKLPKIGAKGTAEGQTSGTSEAPEPPKEAPKPKESDPPKATVMEESRYNSHGKSIDLDPKTFKFHVTDTTEPWFVKLYAPWCHHCQDMAPAWSQLGKSMKGKLNVGEVNCEAHKQLCRELGVKAFPTIKLFRGQDSWDYEGPRGLGDFMWWGKRAASAISGVKDVTLKDFEAMEKEEEVVFIYFYDHATTSEDFMAMERLPINTIGKSIVVKTKDPEMFKRFKVSTWPRLVVSKEGHTSEYPKSMPSEMRNVTAMVEWMQENWLPMVPELKAASAKDLTRGKFAVLAIVTHEREEALKATKLQVRDAALEWIKRQEQSLEQDREAQRAAKQRKIDDAERRNDKDAIFQAKNIQVTVDEAKYKNASFAWVDGVFWERWLRTNFGVSGQEREQVIIFDSDRRRYWDLTPSGGYIMPTQTSILQTLEQVVSTPPTLSAKATGSRAGYMLWQLKGAIGARPLTSLVLCGGVVTGLMAAARCMRRRRTGSFGGHHRHQDSKEGLLGMTTANGKAD